ncbi:MAG: lycopene cyclase family protein, partial [Chitinophagaceae bacterium]
DYIIAGAGCAGLSLLMRLLDTPELCNKRILLVDENQKKSNDRTWCFWESKPGFFNHLVAHSWPVIRFYNGDEPLNFSLEPLSYKMIRGADFYQYAFGQIAKNSNVRFVNGKITAIKSSENNGTVIVDGITYTAAFIFSSIYQPQLLPTVKQPKVTYQLLQHFKGWFIETEKPVFDPLVATFMDFRVPQSAGTTFVYVLPFSETKALVEYTFFTSSLLAEHAAYDSLLKEYIRTYLNLSDYTITETEFGVIPMSNQRFASQNNRVIYMGTAGGWTKPSSGFTFQFIQKNTQKIVDALVNSGEPYVAHSLNNAKFLLYDAVLLQVLTHNKMQGKAIFTQLFNKRKAKTILKFLDNETNILEDLAILTAVPTNVFLPAALRELLNN